MEEQLIAGTNLSGSVNPETGDPPMGLNYPGNLTHEQQFREDFRRVAVVATPQNILFGEYFAKNGDSRVKDKINSEVSSFLEKYNMTANSVLHDMEMALAMDYFTQDPVLQELVYNEAFKEIEEGI